MQAFHSLFHAKPRASTLPAELNAQIITVRPNGGMGKRGTWLCWGEPCYLSAEQGWIGQTGLSQHRRQVDSQETIHQSHISVHRWGPDP